MTALGLIVPCRDEATLIERKLGNLLLCEWPASERPHRVAVVDDGSRDATAELARAFAPRFAQRGVALEVVANDVRPGKTGAIETGLRALGAAIDVVVLTDADVVVAPGALAALARAFEAERGLAMATGAQRFVESLAGDGSLRARDGSALARADTLYDRLTAAVRALESRAGLVFSVHGQLMAWRRALDLRPTPGIAADDLDLMLQARARGVPIRRVPDARFFEVRAPRGIEREKQAVRRARAWVQFARGGRAAELARAGGRLARWQAAAYARLSSRGAPWGTALLVAVFAAGYAAGPWAALAVALACIAAALPLALVAWRVRVRIQIAEVLEARGTMGDRWETARR